MIGLIRLLLIGLLLLPGHWVQVEATAYTEQYESCQKAPSHPAYGITASGKHVVEGRTLACPPDWEFGTRVYIPAFRNTFICEDRGGAITEGHIDIYMQEVSEALEWGRREIMVYVISD